MTVYQNQIAVAKRLIDKQGGECFYMKHVTVPGAVDWRRSGTDPISYPVKAVVLPGAKSSKAVAGSDHTGATTGPVGTHTAYVAGADLPDDFDVNTDDNFIDATGQSWQVTKGWKLAPDGANILFTLELAA